MVGASQGLGHSDLYGNVSTLNLLIPCFLSTTTFTTMNMLLQSPNTFQTVTLPSPLIEASLTVIQHHLECEPPTFPSDTSWDILCPGPESSVTTFTRAPLTEQLNLQKAALIETRKELADKKTIYITSLRAFVSTCINIPLFARIG